MNVIEVKDPKMLDQFYEDWSLTFEGAVPSDENLAAIKKWLENHRCPLLKEDFYVIEGHLMNEYYHLTGTNAYEHNLPIVVILLTDLSKPENIFMDRFEIGGRWFTDIVDNNARREERQEERGE